MCSCIRTISFCFFSFSRRLSRFLFEESLSRKACSSAWILSSSSISSTSATSSAASSGTSGFFVAFVGNPNASRDFNLHLKSVLNSLRPKTFRSAQHSRISGVVSGIRFSAASATFPFRSCSKLSLLYSDRMAIGSLVSINSLAGSSSVAR